MCYEASPNSRDSCSIVRVLGLRRPSKKGQKAEHKGTFWQDIVRLTIIIWFRKSKQNPCVWKVFGGIMYKFLVILVLYCAVSWPLKAKQKKSKSSAQRYDLTIFYIFVLSILSTTFVKETHARIFVLIFLNVIIAKR